MPMRPEEFLRYAAECREMEKFSRDRSSKRVWQDMAQRWTTCAEQARQRSLSPPKPRKYVNVGSCSIYSQ
jgi:hypothetical protein